ncbi:MAG: SpoIIE family protein phosphatase [Deltaproteobacteria bacterium]|nr:SpoIIE family protein phosphatase [Deltaproteobacteria bacterium]
MKPSRRFKKDLSLNSLRGLESQVTSLLKALAKVPFFSNLPKGLLGDLKLGMIEGLSNAFIHGGSNAKRPAKLRFEALPKKIEICIEDSGEGFPFQAALRRRPSDIEANGRGLWILKNLFDTVGYRRGRPNRLVLVRKLTRQQRLDDAIELFNMLQEGIQQLKPKHHLYDRFMDFVVEAFNVERASFLIYDPESGKLKVATSRGLSPKLIEKIAVGSGEGVAGYVFKTSRPLLVNNVTKVGMNDPRPRRKGYHTSSFVSVPIIASPLHIGEETIGVLNLTDRRDGSRFSSNDLKLLNVMAAQAASAFRIRDLLDTVKQHEGLNREPEIVHEIQSRLLPEKFPTVGDLEISGHCQLSMRGGGDYYDVIPVGDGLRGVVADVSGHDVGSAITMASFRAIFRSMVFDPNSPGYLLQVLRWAMHEDLIKLHQFISCWVFEYRPSGVFRVSGAGHPPVMHYRAAQKKWSFLFSNHLPLGLEDESKPQNKKIVLEKGDLIILYTDGLFDPRMRATGFDKQKFCERVENILHLSTAELVREIVREVAPHHMALNNPDDIALLVLRRRS